MLKVRFNDKVVGLNKLDKTKKCWCNCAILKVMSRSL